MTTQEVFKNLGKEDALNFINSDKTDKKTYDFLVSKGLTDTFEEYSAMFEEINKLSSGEKELSDDELEKVAGGWPGLNGFEIQNLYYEYVENWQPLSIEELFSGTVFKLDATEPMDFQTWSLENGFY